MQNRGFNSFSLSAQHLVVCLKECDFSTACCAGLTKLEPHPLLNIYFFVTQTKKHLAVISPISAGRGGKQPRWAVGGCENRGADYQGKCDLHSSVAVIITVTEPEPSDQTDPWKQVVYKHCQGQIDPDWPRHCHGGRSGHKLSTTKMVFLPLSCRKNYNTIQLY